MKRILINATQREELRVAIVDGQKLYDLDIETAAREQKKGNLYKGRITRVEPSLEACFVEYGADRHGFLPLKEIARSYFKGDPDKNKSNNIRDLLQEGQELVVQVEKEERGNKGAALTTFASLAGRYLVLMPNNPRAGGVSRRVEGEERDEAREALSQLQIPDGMGVIVRTNGIGRTPEELQWDLDYLAEIWGQCLAASETKAAPFLIYQESNIILRALRDYLRPDIGEVMVDHQETYEQARTHMQQVMPQHVHKLKLYQDTIPLFSRFQVESQIESAHQRLVQLPSGGSVVIDPTEALTSIDINSARATGGKSIEETALQTNCEAADEIARQMRLRDLGGLVVIDFIDMNAQKNQREVENRLRQACEIDRARIQLGRISRFGLLEMSRQRLRPSLGEHTQTPCPRCEGRGQIRSVESLGLSILRLIEEECMKDRTGRVIAQLPVSVATFLLNEKRDALSVIEARCATRVTVVPNETLETPNFEILRVRADQLSQDQNDAVSYDLPNDFQAPQRAAYVEASNPPQRALTRAAVEVVSPPSPAPAAQTVPVAVVAATTAAAPTESLWARLKRWFVGDASVAEEAAPVRSQRRGTASAGDSSAETGTSRRRGGQDSRNSGNKSRDGGSNNRRGGRSRGGRNRNEGARRDEPRREERPRKDEAKRDEARADAQREQQPQQDQAKRERPPRQGRARKEAQELEQADKDTLQAVATAPTVGAEAEVEASRDAATATAESSAEQPATPDEDRPKRSRRRRGGRNRNRGERSRGTGAPTSAGAAADGPSSESAPPSDETDSQTIDAARSTEVVTEAGVVEAPRKQEAVAESEAGQTDDRADDRANEIAPKPVLAETETGKAVPDQAELPLEAQTTEPEFMEAEATKADSAAEPAVNLEVDEQELAEKRSEAPFAEADMQEPTPAEAEAKLKNEATLETETAAASAEADSEEPPADEPEAQAASVSVVEQPEMPAAHHDADGKPLVRPSESVRGDFLPRLLAPAAGSAGTSEPVVSETRPLSPVRNQSFLPRLIQANETVEPEIRQTLKPVESPRPDKTPGGDDVQAEAATPSDDESPSVDDGGNETTQKPAEKTAGAGS
ncbi:Rne/Rng family ribonuclease [Algiphilus sp. W345]|uniref:Ribonuclease E n=1 Tax=Banduia mediterranea TaxID=3075609 RepID=A0ABU2WJ39_9GAMM|nr:Rne/Rng family ribonuclease [Algiphilus sp. W345]MDT0497654.1 Rne/Rng family ribonuclease [Algiphilus sp. W345]